MAGRAGQFPGPDALQNPRLLGAGCPGHRNVLIGGGCPEAASRAGPYICCYLPRANVGIILAASGMTRTPKMRLADHLKTPKLSAVPQEYEKSGRNCAAEGQDHVQILARLGRTG